MSVICGLDEAGRGPLAGPVTAAAVILPSDFPVELLNDSKKLSAKKRGTLEILIKEKAVAWAVSSADEKEIDRINILRASLLAMKQAFESLYERLYEKLPDPRLAIECIADGTFCPEVGVPCTALVRADSLVPAVMAASVLAKTERDRIMCDYAKLYPAYGYERHKGYPTLEHRTLCRKLGPSPIQRMSFSY
ncbi:ribonuclease HII [Treponema maltophilum]|uniref:ribonuclease HII n=1 Tax=Treponema maltophilum TaxID=51160 RepID=UPI003D9419DB